MKENYPFKLKKLIYQHKLTKIILSKLDDERSLEKKVQKSLS